MWIKHHCAELGRLIQVIFNKQVTLNILSKSRLVPECAVFYRLSLVTL